MTAGKAAPMAAQKIITPISSASSERPRFGATSDMAPIPNAQATPMINVASSAPAIRSSIRLNT